MANTYRSSDWQSWLSLSPGGAIDIVDIDTLLYSDGHIEKIDGTLITDGTNITQALIRTCLRGGNLYSFTISRNTINYTLIDTNVNRIISCTTDGNTVQSCIYVKHGDVWFYNPYLTTTNHTVQTYDDIIFAEGTIVFGKTASYSINTSTGVHTKLWDYSAVEIDDVLFSWISQSGSTYYPYVEIVGSDSNGSCVGTLNISGNKITSVNNRTTLIPGMSVKPVTGADFRFKRKYAHYIVNVDGEAYVYATSLIDMGVLYNNVYYAFSEQNAMYYTEPPFPVFKFYGDKEVSASADSYTVSDLPNIQIIRADKEQIGTDPISGDPLYKMNFNLNDGEREFSVICKHYTEQRYGYIVGIKDAQGTGYTLGQAHDVNYLQDNNFTIMYSDTPFYPGGDNSATLYRKHGEDIIANKLDNDPDGEPYLREILTTGITMLDESSVMDPSILLELPEYAFANYVYLPKFRRYYFVTNITVVQTGLYRYDLHVDVLTTAFEQLLQCSGIVERQETDYTPGIPDNRLPVANRYVITTEEATSTPFDTTLSNTKATFLFAAIGPDPN